MLQYPSIKSWRDSPIGNPCIAFHKYDGSNLRWEYAHKRGWTKMGTRRQLFDAKTPLYNQAIELFHDEMAAVVVEQINNLYGRKVERITAFTEFFGPSSFAGWHDDTEQKELKLIDVSVYKQGFIQPKQFVDLFSVHNWCAEVVYTGNMSQQFIDDVRSGAYPVYEGVICKGHGWAAKIKTTRYLDRLKSDNPLLWESQHLE